MVKLHYVVSDAINGIAPIRASYPEPYNKYKEILEPTVEVSEDDYLKYLSNMEQMGVNTLTKRLEGFTPQVLSEQLMIFVKTERDRRMQILQNRVDRYNNQKAIDLQPTETLETIQKVLRTMQALRDFPEKCDVNNPVWPDMP